MASPLRKLFQLFASPKSKVEDEAVDLAKRQFLGLRPDVLAAAKAQNPQAVAYVAQAAGMPVPGNRADLDSLVNRVINPELDRRRFLGNVAGSAAHMVMPESPLTLLRKTVEQLKPNMELQLTPYEMMQYIQNKLDNPVELTGSLKRFDDPQFLVDEWVVKPGEPVRVRDMVRAAGYFNNTDQDFGEAVKQIGLPNNASNRGAFDFMRGLADELASDTVSMNYDDIKHLAMDLADGDYVKFEDNDWLNRFGFPENKIDREGVNSFMRAVDPEAPKNYDHLSEREDFDYSVEQQALDRGYFSKGEELIEDPADLFKLADMFPQVTATIDDWIKRVGKLKEFSEGQRSALVDELTLLKDDYATRYGNDNPVIRGDNIRRLVEDANQAYKGADVDEDLNLDDD